MRRRGRSIVEVRRTLPRLRHHLTSGRKMDTPDDDTELLLEAGLMRDWSNARRLVKKRKQTPLELFWELSKRQRITWRKRFKQWWMMLGGGWRYDPHTRELRDLNKR